MSDKQTLLSRLKDELAAWEKLLGSLTEKQITTLRLDGVMSIKDVIAHLKTWGEISIARMEAAMAHTAPEYHGWPAGLDPDSDEVTDQLNAWIMSTHRDRPWPEVYQEWHEGYIRLMVLGERFSEEALLAQGKYPWMEEHSLMAVLEGSYGHHHDEHLVPLLAWLKENGIAAGE